MTIIIPKIDSQTKWILIYALGLFSISVSSALIFYHYILSIPLIAIGFGILISAIPIIIASYITEVKCNAK